MVSKVVRVFVAVVGVFGVGLSVAAAQVSPILEEPAVPPGLEVPAGHSLFLAGHAFGTQNYMCLPSAKGVAWRFVAPQATLFASFKGGPAQQITTHFLSANPLEDGLGRPTWLDSDDSSRVWGRAAASSTDPNYVEAGAIPWLLVQAVGASLGPAGGSQLAATTYIHRVHTSGGLAPSTGCRKQGDVGVLALVPYETDYYFYRVQP